MNLKFDPVNKSEIEEAKGGGFVLAVLLMISAAVVIKAIYEAVRIFFG